MVMRSKETLFNAALYATGNQPIVGGALWQAMDANYDEIVRAAFEDAAGSLPFGNCRVTLTSRSTGTMGYDDSYALPNDAIHVREVFFSEVSAADLQELWEIDGVNNAVLLNAEGRTIEVEYIKTGQESTWSANFALGVQHSLEAVIKSVEEEEGEAQARQQEADFYFLKAGVKGSKNRSKRPAWKRGGGRILRARAGAYSQRTR